MVNLEYVGPPDPVDDNDLALRAYVESLTETHMEQSAVDDLIASGLTGYALKTEVDALDANLASVATVDAGDAGKLKWIDRNTANGWAGLDSTGRMDISRVALTSTQRWPVLFYTPDAYPGTSTSIPYGSEVTLYTADVADPGIDYKLLVSGHHEVKPLTGGNVTLRVRVGSDSGTVVASSYPAADDFTYGRAEFLNASTANVGVGWEQSNGGGGDGHYASDGTQAYWARETALTLGQDGRFGVCRKIGDFGTSTSDYQELTYVIGDEPEVVDWIDGRSVYTLFYGRVASDWSRYIVAKVQGGRALNPRGNTTLYYNNGAGEVAVGTATGILLETDSELKLVCGEHATGNRRKIQVYYNGALKITWNDVSASALGANFRGWGFGGIAGYTGLFAGHRQAHPGGFASAQLYDPDAPWADTAARAPATLVPADLDDQDLLSGATTLYVTAECDTLGGTSVVTTDYPKLHITTLPS